MLEYVIEGYLMENDYSGYDIKQNMESVKFFNASYGSIYPALKRMEADGLISSREIVEGGKYKRVYSIKKKGREQFLSWLEKSPNIIKSDNEHIIKTFFYKYLPEEKVKESVAGFIKSTNSLVRRMEVLESLLGKNLDSYERAALAFQTDQYRFIRDWYRRFLDKKY